MADYYKLLGLERTASFAEVKKAYHGLAMKFHPDHNQGNPRIEKQFQLISEAYRVLHDDQERSFYDKFGLRKEQLEKVARPVPGRKFEGFVGNMVDEMLGTGKKKPRSGKDHRYRLEITLEEALAGSSKEIRYTDHSRCQDCGGTGAAPGEQSLEVCHVCDGRGEVRLSQSGLIPFKRICEFCEGTGRTILVPCATCQGRGIAETEKEYVIPIPPRVKSGRRLRVRGGGGPGSHGGAAGDLYVEVVVKPHPYFRREGEHIHLDYPIDVRSACLGAKLEAPTLLDRVVIHVPPGTQSGDVLRVRGGGAPKTETKSEGDLFLHVQLELPVLENEQLEVLTRGWKDLPSGGQPKREALLEWLADRNKRED